MTIDKSGKFWKGADAARIAVRAADADEFRAVNPLRRRESRYQIRESKVKGAASILGGSGPTLEMV